MPSSTVSTLHSIVTETIRNQEDAAVTLEDIRVLPSDEQDTFLASAVVMDEIDESIKDPSGSDELQEYLDARTESWMNEVEIEDSELSSWVEQTVSEFINSISSSQETTVTSEPELRFVNQNDLRVLMDVTITPDVESESIDSLRTVLNETSQMIPSTESLRTMTVRLTDFNYDEDDWATPHHDFTIYFATEEPHEYWANCDTLEDYFKMCAKNDEETTVEDMRQKDEYYSHTHLMNDKSDVIDWLEMFTTDIVDEHIFVTDQLTVFPYRLELDFESEDVTLKCDIRKEVN